MTRNVCLVPDDQYNMIQRVRKQKRDSAPPDRVEPLLIVFILMLLVGGAIFMGLYTSAIGSTPFSATPVPAPDNDLMALLDDADAQAMAAGNESWVQQEKREKIAAVTSSAPARFVINTYKSIGQDPSLQKSLQPKVDSQSPAPASATVAPTIAAAPAHAKSPTPQPASMVMESAIENGPPPGPEVVIEPLYVDWPVLLPNYMLSQPHPFQDWCQRIMRVNYGEAAAVLGVIVGPSVTDMEDPTYIRFRDDVRQKLIDFFAERDPNGTYRFYAPSYQRTYHVRKIQFMRAYSADSRIMGQVATLVQSDGRAYAYLFDGHAGFYGTFLNTIGEAYVLDPSE